MTRHELYRLIEIWRSLKTGRLEEPLDQIQTLIANAAIETVIEDMDASPAIEGDDLGPSKPL